MTINTVDITETNKPIKENKKGFEDSSGALPKQSGISDVSSYARGTSEFDKKLNSNVRKAKEQLTKSQVQKGAISEPDSARQPIYGFNKTYVTKSGHLVEFDDSPGHERINIRHKTGSKYEIRPDGSVTVLAAKDRYTAIAGDDSLIVRGNVNVIIESDANIRVQGDCVQQVDGDYNVVVNGNHRKEVLGNYEERVHGDVTKTYTGTYLRDVRGSVTERNLSNYLCWNTGTYTLKIGGATYLSTEDTLKIVSDDALTMECEGGFIDLKLEDSYIVTGISYSLNYHAEQNFYGSQVHADNVYADSIDGDLEGTAKKATYAVTAGAAPTGSASPTTPAATAPTAATASPDSTLEAENVVDNSESFIKAIDRRPLNGEYNKNILDSYAAISRARNKHLRYNSTWFQDQVNSGAINKFNTSAVPTGTPKRQSGSTINKIGNSLSKIGNNILKDRNFKTFTGNKLGITTIPEKYTLDSNVSRGTYLSPNFTVAQFLGGDSNPAQFVDQIGLSKLEIAKNLQLVAFNIMEFLEDKYKSNYTISDGVYNPLENEKLDTSSIPYKLAQGLGVGIQFPEDDNGIYYDVASWIATNLVYDKIILSYLNGVDVSGTDEPTLIVTINNGVNNRQLITEYNFEQIATELQDLS